MRGREKGRGEGKEDEREDRDEGDGYKKLILPFAMVMHFEPLNC